MASLHERLASLDAEGKRRKKRYARYILRQKQHLELAIAKQEELSTENEILKCVWALRQGERVVHLTFFMNYICSM